MPNRAANLRAEEKAANGGVDRVVTKRGRNSIEFDLGRDVAVDRRGVTYGSVCRQHWRGC